MEIVDQSTEARKDRISKGMEGIGDRCPYNIRRGAGDETYELCDLNHKSCLIEHGIYKCEIWEEIQEEWAKEPQGK